tara:strand:- start:3812 stop:5260 length:1449 start_codon:yes stop_codon:yes gene_type:complete
MIHFAILLLLLGSAAAESRPNLLLLLTDDQRWDTLRCMGNEEIHTPNLDALAAQGIRFENAFVVTSICAVSRGNILLGQYASFSGIDDFYTPIRDEQWAESYPGVLRKGGYHTGFIGKWGVGATKPEHIENVRPRFDSWAGFTDQGNFWHEEACSYVTENGHCDCPVPEGKMPHQPRLGHEGFKKPVHLTTRIIPDKADAFFASAADDRPFCLSISFKASHAPFQDWDEQFREDYRVNLSQRPTANLEEAMKQPRFLRESLEADFGLGVLENPAHLRSWMRHYYRQIAGIDQAVGKIVASLKQHGLDSNTVIVFTSDNGCFLGEHGFWGKWLMHEESIRVPFLVFDPRLPAEQRGQVRPQMALSIDIAPTLLEFAGLPIPRSPQGKSLVPLLTDPNSAWRADWFYEHHFSLPSPMQIEASEGVRTPRWKYIRYINQDPVFEQLFDLENDPYETKNLAGDPGHSQQLFLLRKRWEDWSRKIRD